MPPKPVRIGLTKKPTIEDASEVEDEFDNTVPPLSVSVMTALEDIVDVPIDIDNDESSEDLFGDELDRDKDPDYEQPQPDQIHQISKAKANHCSNNQH